MHIKQLNATQLREFIASQSFENMPNLPISRIRAISHCQNPRAESADKLLFLAEEQGQMLGYFGMLPDVIYLNGKAEKVGWMSCLWIDPKTRGRGIAKTLIETALTAWEGRMMVTEFTAEAGKLYEKMGIFQDLAVSKGIRLYDLGKWGEILLEKKPKLRPFSFFIKSFSACTKPFFNVFRPKNAENNLVFIPIKTIDAETNAFISSKNADNLFRRTEKELNWLTHFPWIAEKKAFVVSEDTDNGRQDDDEIAKRYHFSAQSPHFQQVWIQVRERQTEKMIGCFMLSVRENTVKTPYFFVEKEHIPSVAQWILAYMYQQKACILLTFQPELQAYFTQKHALTYYIRPATRHYWLSKKIEIAENLPVYIQDGDGDCAFT